MHIFFSQGSEGFEAQIDKCLENAEYLYDQLQRRSDFQLVFQSKVSQTFRGKCTFYFTSLPCLDLYIV